MDCQAALGEGRVLPALRVVECTNGLPAQDHAVPLPGKDLREAIQPQDGHGHGRLEDRLSGLDCRHVPGHDQPSRACRAKLHRDLGITQKSAWFLAQRLRAALSEDSKLFSGPVEVDETYLGGKRKNMSNAKRKELADTGRGPVGKTAVVGAKDRATNQVAATVIQSTDAATLQGFVKDHADRQATVYTDAATAYESLPFDHDTVKHSLSEYVKGEVHTNGVESFWSMLKRGHYGTFHKFSPKHLDRYVQEFAGRHNLREQDTIKMLGAVVLGMDGKLLKYDDLIRDNGLDSGARG